MKKNSKLERRLAALENQLADASAPLILWFADGTSRSFPYGASLVMRLIFRPGWVGANAYEQEVLDLLGKAVAWTEPAGGLHVNLLWVFAQGPIRRNGALRSSEQPEEQEEAGSPQ